jgi:hypothetical protein
MNYREAALSILNLRVLLTHHSPTLGLCHRPSSSMLPGPGAKTLYFLPITSAYAAALVWGAMPIHRRPGERLLAWLGVGATMAAGTPGIPPRERGLIRRYGLSLALCCVMAFDVWHGLDLPSWCYWRFVLDPARTSRAARLDGAVLAGEPPCLAPVEPNALFSAVVGTIKGFRLSTRSTR